MRSSSVLFPAPEPSRINLIIIGNLQAWNSNTERRHRALYFKPATTTQGLSALGVKLESAQFMRVV